MKFVILVFTFCFLIGLDGVAQTSISINSEGENPKIHTESEIAYDGKLIVIVNKNGKWGGYAKHTDDILPVVFDKIDSFLPGENLVKYNGQWGTYKDDAFNTVENPTFINPEIKAITKSCAQFPIGIKEQNLCVQTNFKNQIDLHFSDQLDELHGFLSFDLIINSDGGIDDIAFLDATNLKIGEEVKRLLTEKKEDWIAAKNGDKNVASSIKLFFNFNT